MSQQDKRSSLAEPGEPDLRPSPGSAKEPNPAGDAPTSKPSRGRRTSSKGTGDAAPLTEADAAADTRTSPQSDAPAQRAPRRRAGGRKEDPGAPGDTAADGGGDDQPAKGTPDDSHEKSTRRPAPRTRAARQKNSPAPPSDAAPEVQPAAEPSHPTPQKAREEGAGDDGRDASDRPSQPDQTPDAGRKEQERDRRGSPRREGGDEGRRSSGRDRGRRNRREGRDQRPSSRDNRNPRQDERSRRGRDRNQRGQDQTQNQAQPDEGSDRDSDAELAAAPPLPCEGLLEVTAKGFGFLRSQKNGYQNGTDDVFVAPEVIRAHGLRQGTYLKGFSRLGRRGPQLTQIDEANGQPGDAYLSMPFFDELTAINPKKRYALETSRKRFTTRVIDMMAPIGRGQRGLIVAPPRSGKTTLLQHIAEGMAHNYPDVHLMLLLIDERPEEVTELSRELPSAEIFASSNDAQSRQHTRIAELAIERAKRLVEAGEDVFMLLDSITRLARAFNRASDGRNTGSGGVDASALQMARRLFAAARNTREAGSLTIVGTALVETGSKGDEVIFQEFKGTGNMELVLDRQIAQNYIYPAVDIFRSGTRREELLLASHQIDKIYKIRRGLAGHKPIEAIERLLHVMGKFESNAQMLIEIPA